MICINPKLFDIHIFPGVSSLSFNPFALPTCNTQGYSTQLVTSTK